MIIETNNPWLKNQDAHSLDRMEKILNACAKGDFHTVCTNLREAIQKKDNRLLIGFDALLRTDKSTQNLLLIALENGHYHIFLFLMDAWFSNSPEKINTLEDKDRNYIESTLKLCLLFIEMAENDDIDGLKSYKEDDLDFKHFLSLSKIAFQAAAGSGAFAAMRWLLKYSPDCIQPQKGASTTALIIAARNNRVDVIEFLLENGADINYVTDTNETALGAAYEYACPDVMKKLFSEGARWNLIVFNSYEYPAISTQHVACDFIFNSIGKYFEYAEQKKLENLKFSLEVHPCFLNARNKQGETALQVAQRIKWQEGITLLSPTIQNDTSIIAQGDPISIELEKALIQKASLLQQYQVLQKKLGEPGDLSVSKTNLINIDGKRDPGDDEFVLVEKSTYKFN